jgi:tetratricopeptide (TPR) repeat protein
MGQYDRALPLLRRHSAHYPDNWWVHFESAFTYAQLGQDEAAREQAAQILRLNRKFSLTGLDKWRGPYKDQALWRRYLAAWRRAGLN